MKNVSQCKDQCWAGQPVWYKNFNVAIFLDTVNVIKVKLCVLALVVELYLFVPLSVALTIFQGLSSVNQL